MKIFLLGASGFVGKHLYKRLVDEHEVVTDMRYFDDRYDIIVNLAAVTHTFNIFDPKLIESNIILADKVFKRPERIIYASSCSAEHFTNPYALSKQWCEYLGKKHGNAIGVRFYNLYGAGNNKGIVKFLMDQPSKARITIRGPELLRDYYHVDDAVDKLLYLINSSAIEPYKFDADKFTVLPFNAVLHVGSGVGTQTMDLVNLYMKLSGKEFTIDVVEAYENEPKSMISPFHVLGMSLEEGIRKTINNA